MTEMDYDCGHDDASYTKFEEILMKFLEQQSDRTERCLECDGKRSFGSSNKSVIILQVK